MGAMSRRHMLALVALVLPLLVVPIAFSASGEAELQGTLRTWHGDTFTTAVDLGAGVDTGIAGVVPLADAGPPVHALAGEGPRERQAPRRSVRAGAGGVQPAGGDVVAAATGTKSVAVLLFNFSNAISQPWTTSYVRGVVFDNETSVDKYYRDASYGQLGLSGDVFGWYTLSASNTGCSYTSWASRPARRRPPQVCRSRATSTSSTRSLRRRAAAGPACVSPGHLELDQRLHDAANRLSRARPQLRRPPREHTRLHVRRRRTTFTGSCTQSEYGDPFTVMGGAADHHQVNWHRAQLGWFADTQTVTSSGSYLLAPAELTSAPRMLRVSRGDGTYLNLELRRPWGIFDDFASSDPVVNGVSVRIAPELSSLVQSKLVDANPATTSFSDAALGVGQTLTDPLTGVSVSTLSVGPSGATVSIQFAGGDTQAPSAPASMRRRLRARRRFSSSGRPRRTMSASRAIACIGAAFS